MLGGILLSWTIIQKIIRANLIAGLQDCIQLCQSIGKDVKCQKDAEQVMELRPRKVDLTTEEDTKALLLKVWKDEEVQSIVKTQPEQLQVSHLDYFYDMIDDICKVDYVPTDDHILRCRQRTTGAYHTSVYLKKSYFEFHDVGGQRPERAKWELVLKDNNYSAILYFVALDEFDTHSIIEKEYNDTKMEISRHIWNELVNSEGIPKSTLVFLFLNRRDLFDARIKTDAGFNAFKNTFPKYKGGNESTECMEVIKSLFMEVVKEDVKKPGCHFTCNLDSTAMEAVWNSLYSEVLKQALAESGLFATT